jgi:hypothetical protein
MSTIIFFRASTFSEINGASVDGARCKMAEQMEPIYAESATVAPEPAKEKIVVARRKPTATNPTGLIACNVREKRRITFSV